MSKQEHKNSRENQGKRVCFAQQLRYSMNFFLSLTLILHALFYFGCTSKEDSTLKLDRALIIASIDDPHSLDPRLVRDLNSVTIMHALFEGLMRTNSQGVLELALASDVEISENKKTYTFTLHPCQWSDGTPLTAEDLVETWISLLSPDFLAPNAYQLYIIKGAKQFKEGLSPRKDVGIKATSPETLIVELETPTPYFLELVSCHFYFPVHPKMRKEISPEHETAVIGNGPFKQNHWQRRSKFEVIKNPLYRDVNAIQLDRITFQIIDEFTALQLFKSGFLNWAGSPLSTIPQDAIATLKHEGILKVIPGSGTHWFRFNTEKAPFNSEKIRRAFALALDRKAIVEHVTQGNQSPAIGIIPPSFGIPDQNYYTDHDVAEAQKLFQEALNEKGLSVDTLPKITLLYGSNDRDHKIAQTVQQQWNQAFNTNLSLESGESKVIFEKTSKGDSQISLGSWYADIQDPINFLEIFQSRDNTNNRTFWHNDAYTTLLEKYSIEISSEKRLKLLSDAEKILMENMPVAPLFYSAFNYLQNDDIQGVYFSPLGYLDFKEAFILGTEDFEKK